MNYTPGSKAAALIARIKEAEENSSAMQALWQSVFGTQPPDNRQCQIWLTRYGFDIAAESISDLANWINKHSQKLAEIVQHRQPTDEEIAEHTKSYLNTVKYASGIMKWKEQDSKDGDQ